LGIRVKKYQAEFHDADEYAHAIRQGDIEHHQLEPGAFYGKLVQVISDKVQISTHSMNRKLLQTGSVLEGYTVFLLPGNMRQDFSWRKQRLTGKRIGLLKGGMPHYSVLPSNFYGTPVSLWNDYLKELIIRQNLDDNLYQLIQQSEVIELEPEDAYQIQKMVIGLCSSENVSAKILINELPNLVLQSIEKILGRSQQKLSDSRDIALHSIFNHIEKNLNRNISSKELCEQVQISERSLRYIFDDLTGITPRKFIKNLKLNKVRKELQRSGGTMEIGSAARTWGFNHSGQFAADYKKLFGEYPSETVRIGIDLSS
jgi:AraC family ethanolamine operon transcriptional activator